MARTDARYQDHQETFAVGIGTFYDPRARLNSPYTTTPPADVRMVYGGGKPKHGLSAYRRGADATALDALRLSLTIAFSEWPNSIGTSSLI
jgi:hypothetical protein